MEAAIREYAIPRRRAPFFVWRRLAEFLSIAMLVLFLQWAHSAAFKRPPRDAFDVIFMPLLLAAWFTTGPLTRLFSERKSLTLGEDFIEYRAKSRISRDRRHIRRDRITSLRETEEGLLVQDQSKMGTFMLSNILVPASMPEYNEIKETLLRWKAAATGTS